MKLSKEFTGGLIIFIGIALLFLLMNLFGLEKQGYLRLLNIGIVYYGIRRSLQLNIKEGVSDFGSNLLTVVKTGLFGIILSVIGLYSYIYIRGGQTYLNSISEGYLFTKNPSVSEYTIGLLFEGIASLVILAFLVLQFWKGKRSE